MRCVIFFSYTAAGGDGDLDGVPARLTHLFQVQGLVGGFVVASLDGERSCVDADLWRRAKKRSNKKTGHTVTAEQMGVRGVRTGQTCTEAGQLVFICRSSWW